MPSSSTSFSLKELKEKFEDGELDLSLSSLTGDDIPLKQLKVSKTSSSSSKSKSS